MSSRRSRPLIRACPPPWDEAVTPLGVRALSRPAVTLRGTRGSRRATGFSIKWGRSSCWTRRDLDENDSGCFPPPHDRFGGGRRVTRGAGRDGREPNRMAVPLGTIEMARRQLPVSVVARMVPMALSGRRLSMKIVGRGNSESIFIWLVERRLLGTPHAGRSAAPPSARRAGRLAPVGSQNCRR